jgi:hypothetical protein
MKRTASAQVLSFPSGRHVEKINIADAGRSVADTLRDLAEMAEKGQIIGAVVVTWSPDETRGQYVSGVLKKAIPLAHYITAKMVDTLLHLKSE